MDEKKITTKKTTTKKASTSKKVSATKTAAKKITPVKKSTVKTTTKKVAGTNPSVKKTPVKKTPVKKEVVPELIDVPPIVSEEITIEENIALEPLSKTPEKTIRKIPTKNYVIAGIIVLVILVFSFFGYRCFKSYQEKMWNEGYFYREKFDGKEIKYNELAESVNKMSGNSFVLINYLGKEETYDLEKGVLTLINDYHLKENFYYLNISKTNESSSEIQKELNQLFETNRIQNLPVVLFLKEGKLVDLAVREDKQILESADFAKILDIYEFRK